MARWAWMLGGLLVWAGHFAGVYALASVADVVVRADDAGFRLAAAGFSLACFAGVAALGLTAARRARRGGREDRWPHEMALGSAVMGGLGIAWQSLPLVVGH